MSISISNSELEIKHEVHAVYSKITNDRMDRGKSSKGDVSLVFVDKKHMQGLNSKYREKNVPTDVLTFVLNKDSFEGEIYICIDVCKENNIKKWVLNRVIHGLLHLDDCHHDSEEEVKINEDRHKLLFAEVF